jgi:Sec-independent protein translocase protein TatA
LAACSREFRITVRGIGTPDLTHFDRVALLLFGMQMSSVVGTIGRELREFKKRMQEFQ